MHSFKYTINHKTQTNEHLACSFLPSLGEHSSPSLGYIFNRGTSDISANCDTCRAGEAGETQADLGTRDSRQIVIADPIEEMNITVKKI